MNAPEYECELCFFTCNTLGNRCFAVALCTVIFEPNQCDGNNDETCLVGRIE